MSAESECYRNLTEWERAVLVRLLMGRKFRGQTELRNQLNNLAVRPIDCDGSLAIRCDSREIAPRTSRIPVEGEALDVDGVTIHYLLHVVDGLVCELEVYKENLSLVLRHPAPCEIRVIDAE